MLHKNFSWIIPTVFYQADGTQGGEDSPQDPPKDPSQDSPPEPEEIELEGSQKLSELDDSVIDQLIDREDVDIDKLVQWMKERNADTTLQSVLIADEKDDNDKDDKNKKDPDDKSAEDKDDKNDPNKKDALSDTDPEKDNKTNADDKKSDDDPTKTKDKTDVNDDGNKQPAKQIKITDDYIKQQVQSFRDQQKGSDPKVTDKKVEAFESILNGIKGGSMDGKSLKNYINAQMYIKTIKSPFDKDWKPDPKVVEDPKYIEEATKKKNEMIVNKVREKFKDFPTDAFSNKEALEEFEDGLSRREFSEYDQWLKSSEQAINNDYDRYVHVVNNWEDIAKDTVTADVKLFEARLARHNLTLKDLGIESLDLDKESYYNKYLWENILFIDGKENQPNPDVLEFMDNVIPIVKPGQVYRALIDLNLESIISKSQYDGRKQGFEAGLNSHDNPSTSQNAGKEHREKIEIDAEDFNDDTTPEEDQKKLDALKTAIINSSGASVKSKR